MRALLLSLAAASSLAALTSPAPAQMPKQWDVYVDRNHCADTRAGWLAVADQHPGFGWDKMPGVPTSQLFMEAIANMDAMRMSTAFDDRYCCKFVVWREQSTSALALVREGDVATAGWLPESPPMCAETAILKFGMEDVLGALTLPLGSVPGGTVLITPNGPVAAGTTAITLPTATPTVIQPGGSAAPVTGGDDGHDGSGAGRDTGGGEAVPDGIARIQGPITLDCTRVDMAGWTYQGSMKLDLKPGGLGTGEIVLAGQDGLAPLTFALQTQLQGQTFVALGRIEPGTDISQISAQVTGQLTGPPQGLTQGTAGIEIGISMRARFANGRTPGDGSCTGRFAN